MSVSMNDYADFGQGFGTASASDVAELNKALNTGAYAQANGVAGQVNGAALQVESLENSLKVLTFSDQHVKFWKKIAKTPAYSTVEEYNQLLSYGNQFSGFLPEGVLPETDDSEYKRQASFVKFLGTTREVTHPMTLVRSAHGDVIARENQNGILWIMKQLEHALFWGDSTLAQPGKEGVQFDGLNKLIDGENVYDCKGEDLKDTDINYGAQIILENFGTPSDLYLPYEVLATFSNTFFPKERVIMPTQGAGYQAGLVINKFQTHGGAVEFQPDLFLQKTKPLSNTGSGGTKAPTAPASLTVTINTEEVDANFKAGTYVYSVTACNRFGESVPVAGDASAVVTASDVKKGVKLVITNSASMVVAPDYFCIYRSEKDGTKKFCVAKIPATSINASGTTQVVDKCEILANTYTAFMGEFTPEVIAFKQLAPIMKMDLALLGPAYRWMILLYGVPQLYAPKKWMKFINIKASSDRTSSTALYNN
jgi:hypothetical protein